MAQVLPLHTFTPRHFESEEGENQPLSAAAREVARDRGAKKCTADEMAKLIHVIKLKYF